MRLTTTAIASMLLFAGAASAECIGSGNLKTCYDNSGNSYTVQKFGDSTYVSGYNSKTGSSWNQDSQKIGNSTFTNGKAADGQSWNSTSTKIGDSVMTYGKDSNGKPFTTVCGKYGCY
ncbi:hypothetical protein [Aeromonas jandaei]|uniref:hypothetical protein n=1 Tax=Aeromonas jandaei TaxID=650 RepID=UPI0011174BF8|nr:hypothetical protein [Aeromonas jandaei]TNI07427.1 hypothetical protein CF104_03955 [Aeromonas jandaei]